MENGGMEWPSNLGNVSSGTFHLSKIIFLRNKRPVRFRSSYRQNKELLIAHLQFFYILLKISPLLCASFGIQPLLIISECCIFS